MWTSRTKQDLIIEVWEKLDCESVGAAEIEAIEEAVRGRYGDAAVESPMRIARTLADEGAALRHSEIMGLWVERFTDQPHEAEFRNLLKLDDLDAAYNSIRHAENIRRKFKSESDKEGLRLLRDELLEAKSNLLKTSRDRKVNIEKRNIAREITEWLTIWLQSPEVFENWIKMRRASADFRKQFGESGN
ncbi:MAG TPA: hypothetical protein VGJ02_05535 [Pyrinomonadaceae bacterium]|jgi:hypothetical protein